MNALLITRDFLAKANLTWPIAVEITSAMEIVEKIPDLLLECR